MVLWSPCYIISIVACFSVRVGTHEGKGMFKKFRAFEAPAYWVFIDPDTNHSFSGKDKPSLLKDIVNYREQNMLEPIERLDLVVDNYLCGLPENSYKCEGYELDRRWSQYMKGGLALLKNLAFKKFATQEEAERRSKICEKCPYNVFPDKGPFMKWSDDIAAGCVGERKTKNHQKLGSCAVCSCVLRSKVFYVGELDKFSEEDLVKLKKVGCWQPKLSGQE